MLSFVLQRILPRPFFAQANRALLCLLMLVLLGAIFAGVACTALDLADTGRTLLGHGNLHHGFRQRLIDALTVLAMVEVYRTALAYFVHGRVKVTYIIDTVLVAILTEVLAFWYREIEFSRMLLVMGLVVVLMLMRILAIHFSPNRVEAADGF